MRIPKRLSHKGKAWKVIHKADLVDCEGLCDFDTRTIYLDKSLRGRKKREVFLHELFHVVIHEAHIGPGVRFNASTEEILCDAFADLLTTSLDIKWKKK